MTKSLFDQRWVAVNGSVYSVETKEFRSEFPGNRKTYRIQPSIAFNVGPGVAEYIVRLHNAQLKR